MKSGQTFGSPSTALPLRQREASLSEADTQTPAWMAVYFTLLDFFCRGTALLSLLCDAGILGWVSLPMR